MSIADNGAVGAKAAACDSVVGAASSPGKASSWATREGARKDVLVAGSATGGEVFEARRFLCLTAGMEDS